MDITPLIEDVRRDLARAADLAGEQGRAAAERLLLALEPSLRLMLIDALTRAAAEITEAADGVEVEVRIMGREPVLVVGHGRGAPAEPAAEAFAQDAEGENDARLTLRLPLPLKERAETLAGRAGQSLNSWLVAAVKSATAGSHGSSHYGFKGRRLQGWAR